MIVDETYLGNVRMAIICPYCSHGMAAKDAKPGKYKPKCAKCGERFALTIFSDAKSPLCERLALAAETLPPNSAPTRLAPAETLPPSAASRNTPALGASAVITRAEHPAATAPAPLATGARTPPVNPGALTTPQRAIEATALFTKESRQSSAVLAQASGDMPATIGGYKLVRELGRGAMGAVYLARQISLDREVALKTIQAQWATNPVFIARFTREAYAAAQLTHHNVVQIYDLGFDGQTNFFSMEFVRGRTLDDLVRKEGKLDAEVAVGYVLQAARGLQFAHNHGMVHRDVKPANLLLNEHGIVKVADLGLVKTAQLAAGVDAAEAQAASAQGAHSGSSLAAATAAVTEFGMAMGTPAYLAPEQAENAAGVDHRADIYSLGCTLYDLLTGRPPFEGASALEVITKHRTADVVRPDAIVKRVPAALSEITLKMVAKKPADRYENLGAAIAALEGFLGIQSAGPFSPREEHAQELEQCAARFQGARLGQLRRPIFTGFGGLLFVAVLAGLVWNWQWAAATACLALAAMATYFVVSGVRQRTYLCGKFRELFAQARWTDWLTPLFVSLVALVVLLALGWLWACLGMALAGVGLGLVLHFVLDRGLAAQRREPLEKMEQLLKTLRLKGVEEMALQQFVAKGSGEAWEEFFESLFGYQAKLVARQQWSRNDKGQDRPRFRGWRDGLVRWIDARLTAQREARDRKHLQKVEEAGLQAQGMDLIAARKEAQRVADALLDDAADVRSAVSQPAAGTSVDPALAAAKRRAKVKTMLAEAKQGAYQARRRRIVGTALSPLAFALGGKVRFLLGCLLVAGCALWARQNGLLSSESVQQAQAAALAGVQQPGTDALAAADAALARSGMEPLAIPLVGPLVSSFNAGLAGLLLLVLGLFRGWKMSLFALPAAAVIVLGPSLGFIPALLPLATLHLGSLAIGLAIGAAGVLFGRASEAE